VKINTRSPRVTLPTNSRWKQGRDGSKHRIAGFSLVEVTMAIGIVTFGVMSIVGVMGVGLDTLKSARDVQTQATILTHVRSQLQQKSLGQAAGPNSLDTFIATPMYFTLEGVPTEAASKTSPYYYEVSFSKAAVKVEGSDGEVTLLSKNAQSVKVSISYPPHASVTRTDEVPLLIARQRE
jgi:uncharacterized protein (TIGR02598 family)